MRQPLDLPDEVFEKLKTVARRRDLSAGYLLARIVEAEIERQYGELLDEAEPTSPRSAA